MDLNLDGKTALVLGVSGGLGSAIARSLRAEEATVIGASRTQPKDMFFNAWHYVDLTNRETVDNLCDYALQWDVDILVSNTGGPPPGEARGVGYDDWIEHFSTMASSLFHISKRLLPGMMERGWGRIITITSSGVVQPIPNLALSNTIRSAIAAWSKTLATEVAGAGVTVNIVVPGRIRTARVADLDKAAAQRGDRTIEEVEAASQQAIPAGRYGAPEEFADVVSFIASQRASYITGSLIRVDGGLIKSI